MLIKRTILIFFLATTSYCCLANYYCAWTFGMCPGQSASPNYWPTPFQAAQAGCLYAYPDGNRPGVITVGPTQYEEYGFTCSGISGGLIRTFPDYMPNYFGGIFTCSSGQYLVNGRCLTNIICDASNRCTETVNPAKNNGQPECGSSEGNPINSGTGNKYQLESDYQGGGDFPLTFERVYNSDPSALSSAFGTGSGWRHSYERSIAYTANTNVVVAYRADGKAYHFMWANNLWQSVVDVNLTLAQIISPAGWQLTDEDGGIETYDASGKLLSLQSRSGAAHTLSYNGGLLSSVTHSNGRSLILTYDSNQRLITLQTPAGGLHWYGYNVSSGAFDTVIYPDQSMRRYVYNELDHVGVSLPRALTGIIDEKGNRYATYQYDAQGHAISSQHAGGAGLVTVSYGNNGNIITDALGTARTKQFQTVQGVTKPTGQNQPAGSGCNASTSNLGYDANGNIASRSDFNGNLSCYAYDLSRNLETTRVEGLASGQSCPTNLAAYNPPAGSSQRKISTLWHSNYRLPTQIDQAGQRVSFSYDTTGNLLQKTITDTATQQNRSWTYTYHNTGQILTADGPRSDINDITSYTYYNDTATNHHPGDLHTVSNALGHTTTFINYDANGRLLSLVDPNGLVVSFAYDPRGRLTQKTVDGNTTTYDYDPVGNLIKVTRPTGVFYRFSYDAAHRLTEITDALGSKIHYTLDAMGNRIQEDILDANGTVVKTQSRVYDALNRLAQDIGAYNQTTQYQYDPNGNLTQIIDPNGHGTQQQYDSLDRLIHHTDALNAQTDYHYDAQDRLVQVTDANNHSTVYSYNGLGDLTQLDSPNTGITQYSYDSAGNLAKKTDAGGVTATYQYDVLSRLLGIDYPGMEADVVNRYDGGTANIANQKGRLSSTRRGDIETAQRYDVRGNLLESGVQNIASSSPISDIVYHYDVDDRVYEIQPSTERSIQNLYDAAGQIKRVQVADTDNNGTTTRILADAISHLPFGPIKSLSYGNNLNMIRQYDQDYRLTQATAGTLFNQRYAYEANGNLQFIEDDTRTVGPQAFGYDPLGRLASFGVGPMKISYQYDAVGNRVRLDHPLYTEDYYYALDGQRLLSKRKTYTGIGYSETINYQTSPQGFINQTQQRTEVQTWHLDSTPSPLDYDADQRFTGSHSGTTVLFKYRYDAFGRRVVKNRLNTPTVNFAYDPENRLLTESKSNSPIHYIYLDDQPLARIDGNGANASRYYFHNNHLGAPVRVSSQAGAVVWSDEYDPFANGPFGQVKPINPGITQNLRLPGQYNDEEWASTDPQHYNIARYYDPGTGRYRQSDPIGLTGGINTYAYVGNNPLNYIDPLGLTELAPGQNPLIGGGITGMGSGGSNLGGSGLSGGGGKLCPPATNISNSVPGTVARVVPENPITRASGTLGRPGANDVFVTAADDILGLNAKQIAERLTIPDSPTGFRVIEFPTPMSGIASPINRTDPGFIGGGLTAGGAREFVIHNGAIPSASNVRIVP